MIQSNFINEMMRTAWIRSIHTIQLRKLAFDLAISLLRSSQTELKYSGRLFFGILEDSSEIPVDLRRV